MKPCPFCGEKEKLVFEGVNSEWFGPHVRVNCRACGVCGPLTPADVPGEQERKAIGAAGWDKRIKEE